MKKTLLFLLLGMMSWCQPIDATCPLRRTFSVKQSDGTFLEIQKQGNGQFLFYSTVDGIALMRAENGDFQYAKVIDKGLLPCGVCAHDSHFRSSDENMVLDSVGVTTERAYQWMNSLFTNKKAKEVRGMGNKTHDGLGIYGKTGSGIVKSIGAPIIPVVMVEFPDRSFMKGTTSEKVTRMLNEPGYKDEKYCKGSVKDYFTAQSNGLFTPSYEVVAKVRVSKPYAEYGKNGASGNIDLGVKTLVREALDLAHASGADFSKYAKDAGRVPLVSIYYAGPGEHSSFETGCEDYLWAHFSETSFTVDGVGINSYFVGNEVLQTYEKGDNGLPIVKDANFDGIGIFVHEFGHALGLPDFYQTRGSEKVKDTPDYWSVMDYGQYFYDGYAPIGYSAFERSSLGWVDIKELTEAQYVEVFPFGQEKKGNTAYCIKNDANSKEYFILENRQPDTWYPALMGSGMLITHVDYDESSWAFNEVNNKKDHQRYEVIPADNVKSGYENESRRKVVWDYFKADLFPGLKQVTSFTDTTLPASKVYTGVFLNKPIYNIEEKDGIVSFSFMDKNMTGIDGILSIGNGEHCEIYTILGVRVSQTEHLRPGVYLIKSGDSVKKVYKY